MIIEILPQTYECGSNEGITDLVIPGILVKLNTIIEWDFCKFPEKVIQVRSDPNDENSELVEKIIEDRDFLGKDDPELKPGNYFRFQGQIIAIDSEDRLVLASSDTGYNALSRIFDEFFKVEFEMMFNSYDTEDVNWEVVESGKVPDEFNETYHVPYQYYKVWKERFVSGRGFITPGLCIKVTMMSEFSYIPVELYMLDWSIKYNPTQFDQDEMEQITLELLSWFYEKYDRVNALDKNN